MFSASMTASQENYTVQDVAQRIYINLPLCRPEDILPPRPIHLSSLQGIIAAGA